MEYTELTIPGCDPEKREILTALLSDLPFESFSEEGDTLRAYIPSAELAAVRDEAEEIVRAQGAAGYSFTAIGEQNWNALWESNFEPVAIGERCMIRAPFHPAPASGMDIVIMPKMSFGTGHHATTHLVTGAILDGDFRGLRGLDMGSGTGVLAIAAVKCGAEHLDAVDIDEWAYENCVENIAANGVGGRITPILGDVSAISGQHYDFILANINRNILLRDMPSYAATLRAGGVIIVSGILEADVDVISARLAECGFVPQSTALRDGWAAIRALFSPISE